jgi:outer membrane murein-binding lipoprotein Lpp
MNGVEMNAQETAEIAARLTELEGKVDQLEELARQVAEGIAATSSSTSR